LRRISLAGEFSPPILIQVWEEALLLTPKPHFRCDAAILLIALFLFLDLVTFLPNDFHMQEIIPLLLDPVIFKSLDIFYLL